MFLCYLSFVCECFRLIFNGKKFIDLVDTGIIDLLVNSNRMRDYDRNIPTIFDEIRYKLNSLSFYNRLVLQGFSVAFFISSISRSPHAL